jgi:hypothetical protein
VSFVVCRKYLTLQDLLNSTGSDRPSTKQRCDAATNQMSNPADADGSLQVPYRSAGKTRNRQ